MSTRAVAQNRRIAISAILYSWGFNIQSKLQHICFLNIFLTQNFKLIWLGLAISDRPVALQLKNLFFLFLRYWKYRNPSQSDR